jgi:hypothetical protein
MCQKSNAEFSNYTKVKKENLKFLKKKNLKWFFSSKKFKRGFCSNCGSSLFFQSRLSNEEIAISSGSLNSKVPVKGHIFYKIKNQIYHFPRYTRNFLNQLKDFLINLFIKLNKYVFVFKNNWNYFYNISDYSFLRLFQTKISFIRSEY